MLILYLVTILFDCLHAVYFDDYDHHPKARGAPSTDDIEFEPVMTLTKDKEKLLTMKNIDCDNFAEYARNCTNDAASVYNSVKKSPPMPGQVYDWCKAIRHLTNCAIDWNSDCKDVTDSHFNEESIRGHMHVVNNICNDEAFLSRYDELPGCIEGSAEAWEKCYAFFKAAVDEQKNTTHEWTHFETHFFMCCARAKFRRCTADALFDIPKVCPYEQAVTLQQFSAIVSEGDVFQNCDINVMYDKCPGGDPRPTGKSLSKLMNQQSHSTSLSSESRVGVILLIFYFVCGLIK
ncbi:uncharacterized protein LOC118279316 [Spodoptera frugiperda]|uniref:Uncharacterized protein LOC118279316 n=1 Tax=Spodoptera frugiperda TaxID=7108 RepID=A0A9R0DIS2_SPOFR|nr:uncharacterized protein LOC118279316 [Spodoptera frugiperda]